MTHVSVIATGVLAPIITKLEAQLKTSQTKTRLLQTQIKALEANVGATKTS